MTDPSLDRKIRFNAQMIQDHADGLTDDIDRDEFDSAYMALDALMEYAGRLMRNLEDHDNEVSP